MHDVSCGHKNCTHKTCYSSHEPYMNTVGVQNPLHTRCPIVSKQGGLQNGYITFAYGSREWVLDGASSVGVRGSDVGWSASGVEGGFSWCTIVSNTDGLQKCYITFAHGSKLCST
jgi:hypothetical protein